MNIGIFRFQYICKKRFFLIIYSRNKRMKEGNEGKLEELDRKRENNVSLVDI